jgi:hypothetical protein
LGKKFRVLADLTRSAPLTHLTGSAPRTNLTRFALLLFLLAPHAALAQRAQTDLLIIPFVGEKFAGRTSIVVGEPTASERKLTFGLSTLVLSDKFLGVEADVEHTPQFYGAGVGKLVSTSAVTTLTGNIVVAVPRAITRDSLRPYIVSGLGLMHTHLKTQGSVLDTSSSLLGLDIGGGVIGLVSPRAGVRFELRHFKNLSKDANLVTIGGTKLSFWRVTAGAVLRD